MTDHKWAKLIRFVPGPEIDNLLTSYDAKRNILRINKSLYDLLPSNLQEKVWRLQENTELRASDDGPEVKQKKPNGRAGPNSHKGGTL